ncbi:uncharacterized protein NECHADRAFT_104831 [Fusarium vanettenii 77-13-4]|uniref:Proteophosphoglycan 5 n=1 Tax=Fusarium vanettenii (strain ATCC MYA-4622 / CBS 123669 / FGSC 9596 / NRRL 45880 / 77-13-4) TaxID=660122 RepID=C7Z9Y1_FUSV7|nr:uncharacterized protein NECHADRAFT_104831 [Fusarium vanettenii 77-13-4]EEU39178.1 hypothetical protein NECHADRAFT_104831 [Fusarium vanettenii 77-13-4]
MSETPSQPTTTPARRRQGRGNGRPAGHKAYASENDVVNLDPSRYERGPRTPQKGAGMDSPAAQSNHTYSKQRSRSNNNNNHHGNNNNHNNNNKPRNNKNSPNSPDSARPGRRTPPNQSSMKSTAGPAFAGATFHASPAPSALPLPSFVTRSSMESPSANRTLEDAVQEPSPPSSNAPTPLQQPSSAAKGSPLDFMFRAHREEKERQRSGSSVSFRPSGLAHDSPSSQSPFEPGSVPKPATLPQTARTQARYNGPIDSADLNATPGQPMGPAFSTPYQERIKAARSNSARTPATLGSSPSLPRSQSHPESDDPTEALKKFLFGSNGASAAKTLPNGFSSAPPSQPFNHPRSGPGAPVPYEGRPNNLRAMEDDLRRILKLDLAAGSSGQNPRLFS